MDPYSGNDCVVSPEADHEFGLRIADHDIETCRLLEARPNGKLPPKKLKQRMQEIYQRRMAERQTMIDEFNVSGVNDGLPD